MPNESKLSDGGWRSKTWNTKKSRPPASVRWSAWLGIWAVMAEQGARDKPGQQHADESRDAEAKQDKVPAGNRDRNNSEFGETASVHSERMEAGRLDEKTADLEAPVRASGRWADGVECRGGCKEADRHQHQATKQKEGTGSLHCEGERKMPNEAKLSDGRGGVKLRMQKGRLPPRPFAGARC